MLDQLLSLLAPHTCVTCGREGNVLCSDCVNRLPVQVSRCLFCYKLTSNYKTCVSCRNNTKIDIAVCAASYKGQMKELMHTYKFLHAKAAVKDLNALLQYTTNVKLPEHAMVTWVPTVAAHIRLRGFDHAKLLAKTVARNRGLTHAPTLQRLHNSEQKGANRKLRLRNMQNAFVVTRDVVGKTIVLVDDVITTGATVRAAAAAIHKAGAKNIIVIAIAKV